MPKINYTSFFYLVFSLTIIKIFFSIYFGDDLIDMEWGIINQNLINYGVLSYHEIEGTKVPSIYMPPLYSYFLYSFSFLNLDQIITTKLILFVQCVLSSVSIFIFYRILRNFFDEQNSYIISIIYFIYPLNFYAASQISSVSIQVFCFIYFLYFLTNLRTLKDYILLGLFSGLLILVRGEFWPLFLLIMMFKIIKNIKLTKNYFITFIVTLLLLSPVLIKNYKTFDQLIITKSFGYNLWRGNSEVLNINGNSHEMLEIKGDFLNTGQNVDKFELYVDNYFLKSAKKNLIEDPYKYAKHYLNKFFAFSIFNYNSNYPNYYNPLVFIPEIIVSIFAILGIINNIFKTRDNEILIILLYYLALIPVFFVLPRYKLFILPLYFIFASQFYFSFKQYFFKKTIN